MYMAEDFWVPDSHFVASGMTSQTKCNHKLQFTLPHAYSDITTQSGGDMSHPELPATRIAVSQAEIERLQSVIRQAERIPGRFGDVRVVVPEDAPALAAFLAHDSIGPRIYTMPPVIDAASMRPFIDDHLRQRARGEGVLFAVFSPAGDVLAYFDVELWAEWGACKFGGAVTPLRQGRGFGGATTIAAIDWCFHHLGVARICETTAPDNDRSIRLLSRLGFVRMGDILSTRPDGSTRPSLVWEMERTAWTAGFRKAG
jgi:RimJ/RimL family protein N-acetyltransferase